MWEFSFISDISSLPVSCENESPEIPHFNEEFSSTKSGEENSEQIFNSDGHKLIESKLIIRMIKFFCLAA